MRVVLSSAHKQRPESDFSSYRLALRPPSSLMRSQSQRALRRPQVLLDLPGCRVESSNPATMRIRQPDQRTSQARSCCPRSALARSSVSGQVQRRGSPQRPDDHQNYQCNCMRAVAVRLALELRTAQYSNSAPQLPKFALLFCCARRSSSALVTSHRSSCTPSSALHSGAPAGG